MDTDGIFCGLYPLGIKEVPYKYWFIACIMFFLKQAMFDYRRVSNIGPGYSNIYEQRPKRFMQKPVHERSYGGKSCPNHGKRYGELLKAIT